MGKSTVAMGGKMSQCSPSTSPAVNTYEAIAEQGKAKDWDKGYTWYGLHILTAKCKGDTFVGYEKQINIMGLIVVGMVALIFLFIMFKMMHRAPRPAFAD